MVNIYTLSDPITGRVRYVGKTINLKQRFNKHILESRKSTKSHKKAWINSLLNKNLKPIINIIDIVDEENWGFWEQYWISQFKTWGFKLTNTTDGGESGPSNIIPWNKGLSGYSIHTEEYKKIKV